MEEPDMGDFGDFYGGGGFNDFTDDGPPPMAHPGGFRGRGGGPWRGRGGGRGGHFDGNGFGPRGPPRFRGRGGFMGPGMRGGPRGFRGGPGPGHFERPFRPHGGGGGGGGGWNGPPPRHMGPIGGGPPGMGIDGQSLEMGGNEGDNIWAETKTDTGSSYYYNTKTRVTSWERPEGPNIKIMSHEEYAEIMKASEGGGRFSGAENSQSPSGSQSHSSPSAGFGKPGGGGNLGYPIPGQFKSPGENPDGAGGMQHDHSPQHGRPLSQGGMGVVRPPMGHQGPPAHPGQQPTGFPPFGGPPPGFGMPFPNNFQMVPPPWNAMTVPPPAAVPAPLITAPDPLLQHVDQLVISRAFEWTEHVAPDGKPYYFNVKTQTSVWEKPKPLTDLETAKILAQQRLMQQAMMAVAKDKPMEKMENKLPDMTMNRVREIAIYQAKESIELYHYQFFSNNQIEPKRTLVAANVNDKGKPVSSTPVTGTPWCVVWTGDKRVFFYNPSTKSSVWERPPELIGRLDVEELLIACPDAKTIPTAPVKKAEATSTSESAAAANAAISPFANGVDTKLADKRNREQEEGAGEPPEKKVKKESDSDDDKEVMILEYDKEEKKDPFKEANALEAEVKAARERAIVPLEIRLQQFKDMLIEKQVSAFSTWEKELHKIVFDSRYLLLTSKERKAAFDDYVKERALEERREKKARLAQSKENFMTFLEDVRVHIKMSYNEFSQKFNRDERYKMVEKSRDREAYFNEHITELKRKERDSRKQEKDKIRNSFTEALQEKIKDYHLRWGDVKKKFDDPRFNVLDSEDKEELYRAFQKRLKSDLKHKKKKKKARAEKEKKQEKDHDHDKEEKSAPNEADADLVEDVEDGETPDTEKSNDADAAEGVSEEEEGVVSDDSDEEGRIKKEKAEHSIREREKEVHRALATHLRDRDKEREFYRHEEAIQEFQTLLTDLVRTSEVSWKEAKKTIKKDRRWESISVLSREEMEEIFNQHLENVAKKKKLRFRDLLQEARVKLNSTWKDVRRKIRDDPRFQKYCGDERKCEREFQMYLKDLTSTMKSDFRALLKETKMLNYKTNEQIRENPQMIGDIAAVLEKDKRYLNLECMSTERTNLLLEYLEELERKGPPPPPTASDKVSRRLK